LVIKWRRAIAGQQETEKAYRELTSRLDSDWVDAWTEQAERADIEGGDSLRVYNVNLEHGEVIREI
jgi:hypothetical protein